LARLRAGRSRFSGASATTRSLPNIKGIGRTYDHRCSSPLPSCARRVWPSKWRPPRSRFCQRLLWPREAQGECHAQSPTSGRPRALATGASSGIDLAYAERLAREGYDLVLVARQRERLDQLAERLRRDNGIQADVLCADLTNPQDLAQVETRAGSDDALTLLINNAGFSGYQPFVSIDPTVIDDLIGTHVRTVARLSRAALPGMIRRGSGAVINVASLLAISAMLPPTRSRRVRPMPVRRLLFWRSRRRLQAS